MSKGSCQAKKNLKVQEKIGFARPNPTPYPFVLEHVQKKHTQQDTNKQSWGLTHPPNSVKKIITLDLYFDDLNH